MQKSCSFLIAALLWVSILVVNTLTVSAEQNVTIATFTEIPAEMMQVQEWNGNMEG